MRREMDIERPRLEDVVQFEQNLAKALNHFVYAIRSTGINYSSKSSRQSKDQRKGATVLRTSAE